MFIDTMGHCLVLYLQLPIAFFFSELALTLSVGLQHSGHYLVIFFFYPRKNYSKRLSVHGI
jgi:hypothetical protein